MINRYLEVAVMYRDTCLLMRARKCYSCVFMQKDDAEQDATGIGGLRGRELGQITEDVLAKVGIYFYAGGSAEQSRQEKG